MRGAIGEVGVRHVSGWVDSPFGEPQELIVSVDGAEAARAELRQVAPGVGEQGTGPVDFRIEVSTPLQGGSVITVEFADGEPLENSPYRIDVVAGGRRDKALCTVTREMKILEIGPSYNPTAPRFEGWNSFSLDHASQEELRAKYAGQQNLEGIEPVDFIWRGGALDEAVPIEHHGTFDVVLASHVIEHFPDPIAFYHSAARLLKPGGVVSLIVPDKRAGFDFFKPVTVTSDLLTAHRERRTRHTRKTAFDSIAGNVFSRGDLVWTGRPTDHLTVASDPGSLQTAAQMFEQMVTDESAPYVDYHNTVYTPASFALSILELGQLGVIPFEIAYTYPSEYCEFFVTLRSTQPRRLSHEALTAERLRLMKETVRELAEQANWLSD